MCASVEWIYAHQCLILHMGRTASKLYEATPYLLHPRVKSGLSLLGSSPIRSISYYGREK